MGRRRPSAIYWVCTFAAAVVAAIGAYAAKASGAYDYWTLGGAVVLAVVIWLAGLVAG
jgi:hypothetical protein